VGRHLLAVVAGIAAGAGLVMLVERVATREVPAQLVADTEGRLAEVSLHFCEEFEAASCETIGDFVSQLDPATQVNVVVERQAEFDRLQHLLVAAYGTDLPQLRAVVTGFSVTPWSKDRYGTMLAGGKAVICTPERAIVGERLGARGDSYVPALLAGRGVELRTLPFRFDGGDLICSEERIFMAANCLARNQPYDRRGRAELIRTMGRAFGKPITVLGDTPDAVPAHHIGMYLTPLGHGLVAVGDPDLGLTLYRECRPLEASRLPSDDMTLQPFRHVIDLLEAQGLTVIRIPLVVTAEAQVYMTYNNGIAETRDGERCFYMPTYGVPELDDAAAACYEQAGIKVKRVRVGKLYRHTGSLRCLIGIMRRSEERQRSLGDE
jgi:hypothetical protein